MDKSMSDPNDCELQNNVQEWTEIETAGDIID